VCQRRLTPARENLHDTTLERGQRAPVDGNHNDKGKTTMNYTVAVDGQTFDRVAWTGGDTPPRRHRGREYRAIRRAYFRESLADCGGLGLWACAGTTALDRARIFWRWAAADSWRTVERARAARTARGRVPARAFCLGAVEHVGAVSIVRENGAYILRRHPGHPAGHLIRSCRTLREARRMAAAMQRGDSPERRDY